MKNNKNSILKRMIGKRVFVIEDIEKYIGYIAQVVDIKDENHVVIQNDQSELIPINIFNVRSIPYEW